jgi:hypothetical protein
MATWVEVARLSALAGERTLISDVAEQLASPLGGGPLLLAGHSPLIAQLAELLHGSSLVVRTSTETGSALASEANLLGATVVLDIESNGSGQSLDLAYWAGYASHSQRGEWLVSELGRAFASFAKIPAVTTAGMSLPLLRETKMTSVRLTHGNLDLETGELVVSVLARVLEHVIHS